MLVAALAALLGGVSVPVAAATAAQPPQETSGQPVSGHTESRTTAPQEKAPPLSAKDQAALQAASVRAHNTGRATSVSTMTTETADVTADPKGGFTFIETQQPVRARRGTGWVPVDTTLRRNVNGTFSPVATAYGTVTFSGGGTGPLATTTSGSTTMAVSWPTALPTPTASGDRVTYPAVLPGVDLVLTANSAGGFSDVLVVRDPTAARNPALADIELPVRITGGTLAGAADGGLRVTPAHGGRTLVASAPRMWDSSDTAPATEPGVLVDRSDLDHAGSVAHQSGIHTTVTRSRIALVPDPSVLTGPHTVYPVYIDPSVQWSDTAGGNLAYTEVKQGSPCHHTSFFKGANANGQPMGAGFNHFDSCIGIERAYYQWSLPKVLAGATVNAATMTTMKEFSAACISSTDRLRVAGAISSRTTWDNQPALGATIATITVGPAGCAGHTGEAPAAFNVTRTIQAHRTNAQITFALTGNEGSSAANLQFSRFAPFGPTDRTQPTLKIQYNRPPSTPRPISATSGSDKTGCVTSATGPYPFMGRTIATNTPVLSAVVSDPDRNIVQAKFQYWVNGTSTVHTVLSPNLASGQTAMGSLAPAFVSALTNGQVVDWNVAAFDGIAWSPFSATCHFTAEPVAPAEPTIASADSTFESIDAGQVATDVSPTDQWPLDDTSGAATDSAGTNPATPTGTTAWTHDATRGQVLGLDGTSGYARAATPGVSTTGSFSVSAWVKLNDLNTFYTVVSQAGSQVGAFYLQYSFTADAWSFVMPSADALGAPQFAARALAAPPAVNAWTNLIGTFDSTTGAMTLYVNGVQAGTGTDTATPWSATGPLTIGAVAPSGAPASNFVNGDISDVQVYDSVLSADDAATIATPVTSFTGTGHAGDTGTFSISTPSTNATKIVYSLDQQPAAVNPPASQVAATFTGGVANVPTGRWRLSEPAGSTTLADGVGGHAATLAGNATLVSDGTRGTTVLSPGTTGYAHTATPVVDTTRSFSVSAWVKINNLNNYYTAVSEAGANVGAFYLQYNHAANAWSFVMPGSDALGATQYNAHAATPPTVGAWTNLVATYNATNGLLVLYVNGVQTGTVVKTATPWHATSGLTIGAVAPTAAAVSNNVAGQVSDVQVYDRVLDPVEAAVLRNTVTVHVRPLAPGPHRLFAYAMDAAGDTSGFSHNVYSFQANGDPADKVTCTTWSACLASRYGNDAIQSGTASTGAGADGADAISQSALAAAGWNGPVTVDGATFTLPGTGPDNVLAANQTIGGDFGVPALSGTGTTALVFLATSTGAPAPDADAENDLCGDSGTTAAPFVPGNTPVSGTYQFQGTNPAELCGATGTISYSDGGTQTYQLSVPDWLGGPSTVAAVTLPGGELTPAGKGTASAKIYAFSVPLSSLHAGRSITSITLPDVSMGGGPGTQSLHIFGIAPRNTTTSGLGAGQTWTGSWANPTEGLFDFGTTAITGQTYRIALKPSLVAPGTAASTVRFKFDNSLGAAPLPVTAATVAVDSGNGSTPSATPAATPVALTFGGAGGVTVPEGGMVYSDPVTVPIAANHFVLVSFQLNPTATISALPEHTWSGTAWEYTAPGATHAADASGTAFTGSNGAFTNVVTGMDVVTNGTATQVVLGDNLVDPDEPNASAAAESDLTANFTAAEPTAPASFGTLGAGIEANEVLTDNKEEFAGKQVGGPSVLSRLDRDVLDQPNVTTVILDEGLEDVLNGATADDLQNGFQQVLGALANAGITVVAVTLPPCAGYPGGGPQADDPCTTTDDPTTGTPSVESQRVVTNGFLTSGAGGQIAASVNTDDVLGMPTDPTDPASAIELDASAAAADHVNLNPAGIAALSTAYMGPVDQWLLNDAEFDPTNTGAEDTIGDARTPWSAIHNLSFGQHDATVSATGFSWATVTDAAGAARDALSLDGVAGDAITAGPVIDTSASFSISAWVDLPSAPTSTVTVVSQDGLANTGAALRYDATDHAWAFTMATADAAGATQVRALSQFDVRPNTWTHLVATYDATSQTATLYVNGATNHTATWPAGSTHWQPTGPLSIGASLGGGFLPGSVSDIEAWNFALTPNQANALFQQIQ